MSISEAIFNTIIKLIAFEAVFGLFSPSHQKHRLNVLFYR